jgi:ferrous iron transport protein A
MIPHQSRISVRAEGWGVQATAEFLGCRLDENDYHSLVPPEADLPTLADLPVGAEGVVLEVRCARSIARRLMEMGVLPRTRVAVVRAAPLGDPIEIELRGYSLSVRRSEAAGIVLCDVREPAPAAEAAEASERTAVR